ncbi:helix-turn-helix domain-containing protein [Streptomyces sp. NBC_01136]|uniref:helix-turn-helix domain-containing protein n=1 Tax=unclassified Streptomyces TaxID=2593676 RepID=UPI00324EC9C6|nr:helix-turn-helix domain-containing protein [Streptomyces sp. NBC_01136]
MSSETTIDRKLAMSSAMESAQASVWSSARLIAQIRMHATAYADVAAIALLATDLDAAGDFVRRELGELAARSASMEALRTTLYHYIGAERSLLDVARRLHVARGTVTYRVRRAQEVLGHGLDDRRFALHTALALAEELGDAVLLPPDIER